MDRLEEFKNIFFTNELIVILLAVLLVILAVLIIYLIKMEKAEKKNKNLEFSSNNEEFDIFKESELLEKKEEAKENLSPIVDIDHFNDEENAIISTDELFKASKDLSNTMDIDTNEIINIYEEEQERKAVISYEELLKKATSLSVNYQEPKTKDETEPLIKKIEISETPSQIDIPVANTNKVLAYVEEEEFLNVLKKFRMDLET